MTRFRSNIVIDGAQPYAEDYWHKIRVGGPTGVVFHVVKGCQRCKMTTTDQDTAKVGIEPMRTLEATRTFPKRQGNKECEVYFAQNLVAEGVGGTVRVGDEVEVLEYGHPAWGRKSTLMDHVMRKVQSWKCGVSIGENAAS